MQKELGVGNMDTSKRSAGRSVEFLRGLKFGFIRQRFSTGSFWGRKTTAFMFMFPVLAAGAIGMT